MRPSLPFNLLVLSPSTCDGDAVVDDDADADDVAAADVVAVDVAVVDVVDVVVAPVAADVVVNAADVVAVADAISPFYPPCTAPFNLRWC